MISRLLVAVVALVVCISPTQARFLQTDPVGYTADLDPYTYVGNDPTDRADPTGTMAVIPEVIIEAAEAGEAAEATAGASEAGEAAEGATGPGIGHNGGPPLNAGLKVAAPVAAGGKASQLQKNVAQGKAGEAATEKRLGSNVAGKQVTFRNSDGTPTRADFVTKNKGILETKTGNAGLTPGQQKLFNDINAGRQVTPVGQNAANAGLEPGKPTTMSSCKIDRPC